MTSREVARYYDRNTRRFLRFGRSGATHAIHRELWGPGVRSSVEAADYANLLIAEELSRAARSEPSTILDLGCGVGGTLFRLAERFPRSRLHGVTLSRRQVEIAVRLSRRKGLEERCTFEVADFQSMSLGIEADAVIGVEAMAHGSSPLSFLRGAKAHLSEKGVIIVIDDFLAELPLPSRVTLSTDSSGLVDTLKKGWRLPGLCRSTDLLRAAEGLALRVVGNTDLTSLIRLGRPRDRVIARIGPLAQRLGLGGVPFFANLIGGNALQACLRRGLVEYRLMVLFRP